MDGKAELIQLAHLLRVGAQAARDVATLRPRDAPAIEALAVKAERMAADLEAIARRPGDGAAARPPRSPSS